MGAVTLLVVGLAGCGDEADSPEESTVDESSGEESGGDEATAPEDSAPAVGDSDGAEPQPTGDAASDAEDRPDARTCDGIFSMAEIEVLLGEPATLSESTDDSLGQLLCTWETIEDPENLDDVAFGLVIAQVYGGGPIDGTNFVDPSFWPDLVEIDGVGDLAFATDAGRTDFQFVDGQVAGTFNYTFADLGNLEATPPASPDQLEAAFRTMHERVMGG